MKYLVLCPSNQDRNRYSDHPDISERDVMHAIAHRVPTNLDGVTTVVINGAPESEDQSKLEGLISQLDRARTYLEDTKVKPEDAVILSLHSDSGTRSHVFGCYGGQAGDNGYALAMAVAECVSGNFNVNAAPYALPGYLFHTRRGRYVSALVECGSHQNPDDTRVLLTKQSRVGLSIMAGVMGYFGMNKRVWRPTVMDNDAGYFSMHGKPYNPDAAIAKHWSALRSNGVNLGPALTDELEGARFGENGHIFQFFESAAIVCHPEDSYSCFLWQTFLHIPIPA